MPLSATTQRQTTAATCDSIIDLSYFAVVLQSSHRPQAFDRREKTTKKNAVAGVSASPASAFSTVGASTERSACSCGGLLTSRDGCPGPMCCWPHIPRPAPCRPKQSPVVHTQRKVSVCFCFLTRESTRLSDLEPAANRPRTERPSAPARAATAPLTRPLALMMPWGHQSGVEYSPVWVARYSRNPHIQWRSGQFTTTRPESQMFEEMARWITG